MRIYTIAFIGADPAGCFTAQAFQKAKKDDFLFVIDKGFGDSGPLVSALVLSRLSELSIPFNNCHES